MALFNTLIVAAFAALLLWRWTWETLQFIIILAFAVAGLFIGSALSPGNRIVEGLALIPAAALGFFAARKATTALARAIDRRGGPSR